MSHEQLPGIRVVCTVGRCERPQDTQTLRLVQLKAERQYGSFCLSELHNFWLRSHKVYLPASVPGNKLDVFFSTRKLSVLIKVCDTSVQAEASVHTGRPPDYTFFPFLAHVTG